MNSRNEILIKFVRRYLFKSPQFTYTVSIILQKSKVLTKMSSFEVSHHCNFQQLQLWQVAQCTPTNAVSAFVFFFHGQNIVCIILTIADNVRLQ